MSSLGQGFLQSSVTKHITLSDRSPLVSTSGFSAGTLVAGRVVRTSDRYGQLEMTNSNMHTLALGDIVVGALGSRSALRGHTGHVPSTLQIGAELSLLNIGGVIGSLSSSSSAVGEPVLLEVLGAVADPNMGLLNVSQSPIPSSTFLSPLPPVIVVAGSCMHAGKTNATCAAIQYLSTQGLRCVALKLTGVGAQKDLNKMLDAGAVDAYSFVDAGLPSTCNTPLIHAAKGCLNHAASKNPDIIIVELGDGLLGEYGVLPILNDPQIKKAISTIVFSAADPVGAWGGLEILRQNEHTVNIVTGPCTDNQAGCKSVAAHCRSLAINAQQFPGAFGKAVVESIFGRTHKKVGA